MKRHTLFIWSRCVCNYSKLKTAPQIHVMRHFSQWKPAVLSHQSSSIRIFLGGDGASSGRAGMTSPGREPGPGQTPEPGLSHPGSGWSLPTTVWRRTVWSGASVRRGRGWSAPPAAITSATSVNSDLLTTSKSHHLLYSQSEYLTILYLTWK